MNSLLLIISTLVIVNGYQSTKRKVTKDTIWFFNDHIASGQSSICNGLIEFDEGLNEDGFYKLNDINTIKEQRCTHIIQPKKDVIPELQVLPGGNLTPLTEIIIFEEKYDVVDNELVSTGDLYAVDALMIPPKKVEKDNNGEVVVLKHEPLVDVFTFSKNSKIYIMYRTAPKSRFDDFGNPYKDINVKLELNINKKLAPGTAAEIVEALEIALKEKEEALEIALEEKKAAVKEKKEAEEAKKIALREKEIALEEKEEAEEEKEAALKEKEADLRQIDKETPVKNKKTEAEAAVEEKEAAVKEKEAAVKEKEAAVKEKEAAVKEKEAALEENQEKPGNVKEVKKESKSSLHSIVLSYLLI